MTDPELLLHLVAMGEKGLPVLLNLGHARAIRELSAKLEVSLRENDELRGKWIQGAAALGRMSATAHEQRAWMHDAVDKIRTLESLARLSSSTVEPTEDDGEEHIP